LSNKKIKSIISTEKTKCDLFEVKTIALKKNKINIKYFFVFIEDTNFAKEIPKPITENQALIPV